MRGPHHALGENECQGRDVYLGVGAREAYGLAGPSGLEDLRAGIRASAFPHGLASRRGALYGFKPIRWSRLV